MALAPEEEERLKERYADNRLTNEDWDRIHSDHEAAARILGEGVSRRIKRVRARMGLPPEHSGLLSDTDRRQLIEQAAKRFQEGANAAVEGFIHLFESILDKAVDKAVTKALAEKRSRDVVTVHKRGTIDGQDMDVTESHRRLGPDEVEVRKDGTVGGRRMNAVEIHRRKSAG
jgi:hypothetical protein